MPTDETIIEEAEFPGPHDARHDLALTWRGEADEELVHFNETLGKRNLTDAQWKELLALTMQKTFFAHLVAITEKPIEKDSDDGDLPIPIPSPEANDIYLNMRSLNRRDTSAEVLSQVQREAQIMILRKLGVEWPNLTFRMAQLTATVEDEPAFGGKMQTVTTNAKLPHTSVQFQYVPGENLARSVLVTLAPMPQEVSR